MIRRVDAALRARFLDAARGRPYFGDVMPVHLAVFGESHPRMRFYTATPDAALQLRGRSALLCGTYDREETGGFLTLCGVEHVRTDGAPPAGFARTRRLCCMALFDAGAARTPPVPPLAGLTLDAAPPPGETADFVMRGRDAEIRDNFYSELCAKLARGAAEVWAARQNGRVIATAGAYALSPETASLAAVETEQAARGQGVGSWLVGVLAARLAAGGRRVSLVCEEERTAFYGRLGFTGEGFLWQCERAPGQKEKKNREEDGKHDRTVF